MAGLEQLLADEIKELGGQSIQILNRAVSFESDLETLYKVNLWSRTATRVLQPILSFKAHNETVFYKRLRRYTWTDLIHLDTTFKINSTVHSDVYTHSQYMALKTKDAIVDQCRDAYGGRRPNIDLERPDIVIDVYCKDKDFTISLDSSGDSLHKRRYRQRQRMAPLNEVLAAGMVMLSGWDRSSPLLDPMCGSGTILTEAYMLANKIPPRLHRGHFSFMSWPDYDEALLSKIKGDAQLGIEDNPLTLIGRDIITSQVSDTRSLVMDHGMGDSIHIEKADFFTSDAPVEEGMIIANPPYGMRLEEEDIEGFYKQFGDTLKQKYNGWSAWILCGDKDAIKRVGLRTSKKLTLYNGPIQCKYHRYDMYRGSKKDKAPSLKNLEN